MTVHYVAAFNSFSDRTKVQMKVATRLPFLVPSLRLTAMPLTLYHVPMFRSSRALFMLHELKTIYGDEMPDFNVVEYDPNLFRSKKPETFLSLNPNGKVPVLVDGDVVMSDSCAICLYLLDRFSPFGR